VIIILFQFEPYLQKDNEGFVHHLLVYECHGNYNNSHFGVGFDCLDFANMPLLQCYMVTPSLIAAWGVGGQVRRYREHSASTFHRVHFAIMRHTT